MAGDTPALHSCSKNRSLVNSCGPIGLGTEAEIDVILTINSAVRTVTDITDICFKEFNFTIAVSVGPAVEIWIISDVMTGVARDVRAFLIVSIILCMGGVTLGAASPCAELTQTVFVPGIVTVTGLASRSAATMMKPFFVLMATNAVFTIVVALCLLRYCLLHCSYGTCSGCGTPRRSCPTEWYHHCD